jgi:general secretion pathway protein L
MKLRIFLPPIERADASTRFAWLLFDARHALLREGTSPLQEIPKAEEVELALPASRVLFARLKLPKVSPATIRELLPFAVEDRLLADPSHVHAVAGRTQAGGETLVAVIDREWLRAMLDALEHAGLRPAKAWCESALLAGGHGDWNLVWSADRGMLVDDDGASTLFDHAASSALPLALKLALDEARERGERPEKVRVHHERSVTLPDLAAWSAESGVAFSPGAKWDELVRDEPSANAIDLLQGEFRPRRTGPARLPRAAVVLAAVIALIQLAFAGVDAWRLERERASLEARREAIFRGAFPEAKVVVDPDLQMQRNLAELRRGHGQPVADDFLGKLTRAAREPGGTAKSIEYANGKLVVNRGVPPVAEASR